MDLWEVMVSIFWFFVLVAWIAVLVSILTDLFRDHEASGWAKAGWTLFLIVLPFIGVLSYLIARGQGMSERAWQHAQSQYEYVPGYSREPSSPSKADELAKLADLRDNGAISAEDYDRAKNSVLGPPASITLPEQKATRQGTPAS